MHNPRTPLLGPIHAACTIAAAMALTIAGAVRGQVPPGQILELHLFDPEAPGVYPVAGKPFELHLEGAAGMWVAILTHASIIPTSATTLSPAALDAFYTAWPWTRPPSVTVLNPGPGLLGSQRNVGVPFGAFIARLLALCTPGPVERSQAQPILTTVNGALPGTFGIPRVWDSACASWTAYPDPTATSVQTFWTKALYAESNAPNDNATNTTLFDPYKLGDQLLSSQAGGAGAYDDFLANQAPFLITNHLEIQVTLQAAAVFTLPHFYAATSDAATGPFVPEDPNLLQIYLALSSISAVGYSIGAPSTGVRHPGFTLNGVPLQPIARPNRVDIPCRGAMHPDATLTLSVQGFTVNFTGTYLGAGWMRFRPPQYLLLPVGATVTVLSIQNSVGPMSGFLPGSSEPILWGPLHVMALMP